MEDMVDMVLDMAVDTMVDTVDTMASVRLRLSPRPRLRLILTTMEDMVMEDMEDMVGMVLDIAVDTMVDMVDMVLDMAVDTMVDTVDTMARLRLSPRPRLRLILTTMEDMAMEDMEDMVDMVLDTMAMDMAVNILHQDWNLDSFCPKLSQ